MTFAVCMSTLCLKLLKTFMICGLKRNKSPSSGRKITSHGFLLMFCTDGLRVWYRLEISNIFQNCLIENSISGCQGVIDWKNPAFCCFNYLTDHQHPTLVLWALITWTVQTAWSLTLVGLSKPRFFCFPKCRADFDLIICNTFSPAWRLFSYIRILLAFKFAYKQFIWLNWWMKSK